MKPEVTKYLGRGKGHTRESAVKLLNYFENVWAEKAYGAFAVIERSSKTIIGHCGFNTLTDGRTEFLYAYDSSAWGKGYATEAGKAVLQYAKANLSLAELYALSYPQNKASINVLTKLGFQSIGQQLHFKSQDFPGVLLEEFILK
jgi:ribosomal-protein-alanine N-acetyltransferase